MEDVDFRFQSLSFPLSLFVKRSKFTFFDFENLEGRVFHGD
jgi:hypothetical protein